MFSTPFPNAMGLDIGDLSIKLVQLKRISFWGSDPVYKPVCVRSVQIPHGLIVNGEIMRPEEVRIYLQHLFDNKHRADRLIKCPWVVASLPDTHGFLKLLQIEKTADDIIDEDVKLAAEKHIPFDRDSYYLDWQILSTAPEIPQTNVLITAVSKNVSDMYTYLFESLGLAVLALELKPLATARSMITATKLYDGEARAILDIGATHSSFTVYDHDHIQFNISIPYSGEITTMSIVQKLHLDREEAEKQKIKAGLNFEKNEIWNILSRGNEELVVEMEKAINFYYSHFPKTNTITHITMCGGGSALKRLDKIISERLKIEAAPGKVWKNLGGKYSESANELEYLGYATAIGLALRAVQNPYSTKHLL